MPSPYADPRFAFRFDRVTPVGYVDNYLGIGVGGRRVLVPTLQFTPLDAIGRAVTGVQVGSAYGSDRGLMAVVPGADNADFLYFRGNDAAYVADLEVAVLGVRELKRKPHEVPIANQFDAEGNQLRPGLGFDHIRVGNPGRTPMPVRVVVLVLEAVDESPQGILTSLPLRHETIVVPPREVAEIEPSDEVRRMITEFRGHNFISVKAYSPAD